jgi:TPR repeat protein
MMSHPASGEPARYYLGEVYQYGRGVPGDDTEAMRLYTLAADQVDDAKQALARMKRWRRFFSFFR